MAEKNQNAPQQDIGQLEKVRRDKLAALQAEGRDPFKITTYDQTFHTKEVRDRFEELAGEQDGDGKYVIPPATVSLAGRLMSKRVMGKASFANLQDRDGRIQLYVSRNDLGDGNPAPAGASSEGAAAGAVSDAGASEGAAHAGEPADRAEAAVTEPADRAEAARRMLCSYADFKHLDIGDIIGIKGFPFRTKTGEISVHVKELTLLSKSLEPLPEKFHGLTDTDTRYRQRYVDLIMNENVRETFKLRSAIIREIRNFLDGRGFMEVETPMLVDNAGGAAARPFITHYNALDEDKKLRISLELYLKRLIVGGLERVFEIGRVFRNEGLDQRHNPEFTLMELYQAYTDYNGMMELTESMYRDVALKVLGTTTIYYGDREAGTGVEIDLGKPFRKLTMVEAIEEETGIDFDAVATDEEAKELARSHGIEFEERHKKGDIVNLFFDAYCEDKMIQPTFIMDHPIEISPLTKKRLDDPSKVERFELYINGWEMCNAYSELNDPIDQRARFAAQDANAAAGDEEAEHTDEDFLHAMEIGMPPTGGIGYGIDRFVMLLSNSAAIRDVLLFPTLKSLSKENN